MTPNEPDRCSPMPEGLLPSSPGVLYQAMVEDAAKRIRLAIAPNWLLQDPTFVAWPQTWATTADGLDGIATAAITTRPTFVWRVPGIPVAIVYHDYRWAYTLHDPNAQFDAAIAAHRLPGVADTESLLSLGTSVVFDDRS